MSAQCWYGSDFPPESAWQPFESLFAKWTPVFASQNDTPHELATLHDALSRTSTAGSFNAAFATALMIQESQGNTCVGCGDAGASCGLLQVQGAGVPRDCAAAAHPCPDAVIEAMVACGTVGCAGASGSNVRGCLDRYGGAYGAAARCYNSGSVEDLGDLRRARFGDPRYVQNVANILLGAEFGTLYALDGGQCGF